MPFPTLPSSPTPDQITNFLSAAGESLSSDLNKSVSDAEQAVSDGAAEAVKQVTKVADQAVKALQQAASKAQGDLMTAINQVTQGLGGASAALSLGSVNGTAFYEPIGAMVLFMQAVDRGTTPINLETHEPGAVTAFQALASSSTAELRAKARQQLLQKIPALNVQPGTSNALTGTETVAIILALGTLAMAVGVSIFIVLIAIALIYAISRNYDITEISIEWTGNGPKLKIGAIKRSSP